MYDDSYEVERIEGGQRAIYLRTVTGGQQKILHLDSRGGYTWNGYDDEILEVWTEGPTAYVRFVSGSSRDEIVASFNLDTSSNIADQIDMVRVN